LIFHRTIGYVLRHRDYSETSKIATFYTRDHGKTRVIAKGARRKKSEFLGLLEPLSLLEIVYIERRSGLHILKEAHLLDSNLELRQELSKITHALNLLSLIDQTQPDEDADPEVYELLVSGLSALSHISNAENVTFAFQVHLLRHFGKLPSLDTCARCGVSLGSAASAAGFRARSGVLVCRSCGRDSDRPLPPGTLGALRRLAEIPLPRCGRIRFSRKQQAEISSLLAAMLRTAIEGDLPSQAVAQSLLGR
jgi:DNA repair protein RecO (recombination protein O)